MLIPLQDILKKYEIEPKGIIHVGAHWAEEHEDYLKCGIESFVYIEPCKDAFKIMLDKFSPKAKYPDGRDVEPIVHHTKDNHVGYYINDGKDEATGRYKLRSHSFFNLACGSEEGDMPMYVSHQNQGQSNSLLEPKLHLQQHPEVVFDDAEAVKVVRLDNLPIEKEKYDMLAMDVQGFEGEVLKGATETLKHIKLIYTEVNRGQTYSGNMEIEEMDSLLGEQGFKRVETFWPSPNWTWGDAIYIKI